jgi:hypothetical protein
MNDRSNPVLFRGWLAAIVVVHAVVSLWHGIEHFQVPVSLTTMQEAFIAIVILLLPFAGTAMLWSKKRRAGAWLVTISMFASLLFGVLNHFVLNSPDNVLHVPMHSHRNAFVLSAVFLAVTEAIGTLVGIQALRLPSESIS